MRKVIFAIYSIFILSLGAFIQTNCSNATAQSTVAASSVSFDNSGTGLSATDLQGAIAELQSTHGSFNVGDALVGSWTGNAHDDTTGDVLGTVTLNLASDGSATCTSSVDLSVCSGVHSYRLFGRFILLTFGNGTTDWNVSFVSPTALVLHTENPGIIFDLTK